LNGDGEAGEVLVADVHGERDILHIDDHGLTASGTESGW